MSRYHSVCMECGFEDPNDGTQEEDCGHPFFAIMDHFGNDHEDEEENEEEPS